MPDPREPTRRGYSPWEVVSALQKSCRRSQVREAVYWAVELWSSGHKAWCWNRLQTICTEDIGPADRELPNTIKTLRQWSEKAKDGGGMELTHAVILLATAKKSRIACWMVLEATSDHHERFEIPDEALDQHTRRGKQLGRGAEHFVAEGQTTVDPDDAARSRGFDDMASMLDDLEKKSLEHWLKVMAGDTGDLPVNPRKKKDNTEPAHIVEKTETEGNMPVSRDFVKPAHNDTTGSTSGQLQIADRQDDR